MRLTLRTLLAYLDDVLDPANAREIGQKIEESPVASSLIEKVRNVLRKRSLGAPSFRDFEEFDPNDVAEYLDNILPPDGVADLEKKCLENDARLAETAACHQILSLVVGEPVDISDQTRDRMYKVVADAVAASDEPPSAELGEDTSEIAVYAGIGSPVDGGTDAEIQTTATPAPQSSYEEGIPDYLRENTKNSSNRLVPTLVIGLLCIASMIAFISDPTLLGSLFNSTSSDSKQTIASLDSKKENTPDSDESKTEKSPDDETKQNDTNEKVKVGDKLEADSKPLDTNKTMVASSPDASKVKTSKETLDADGKKMTSAPAPGTKTVVPEKTTKIEPEKAKTPAVAVQPVFQSEKIEYVATNGILMRKENGSDDWFVAQDRRTMRPGDELVSPEPFRTTLKVQKYNLNVDVDGGTSVEILNATKEIPFAFHLHRGQMILAHQSTKGKNPLKADDEEAEETEKVDDEKPKKVVIDGNTDEDGEVEKKPVVPRKKLETPVVLGLQIESELWKIEITEPGTLCGVVVVPRLPHHFEEVFGEEAAFAQIIVVEGGVRISNKDPKKPAIEVISGSNFVFKKPLPEVLANAESENSLQISGDWISSNPAMRTATRRKIALTFFREFSSDAPIRLSLPAVANDPRPVISELAVKALALANSYQDMIQALARGKHEESRQAAIIGLREWLPKSPENRDMLKSELSKYFDEDVAKDVYHLLWGYNKADGQDLERSKILVGWLNHEHVAVRELAIHNIRDLTGRDYGYKPLSPTALRTPDILKWNTHLQREGALIKSE